MNNKIYELELIRSRESLLAAQILLDKGLFRDCVSRAYYAVLHSAKAALTLLGIETNTHNAVRGMFGLHLVKTGKIEKEFAKILSIEQDDREIADYDVYEEIEEQKAKQRVIEAERFIQRIEQYIQNYK